MMKMQKMMRRMEEAKGKLAERNALQRWLARKMLPLSQSLGFSILGDHFYEPVPNLKHIQEHYKDEPRALSGFHDTPSWAENMKLIVVPYIEEYIASPVFEKYEKRNWFYTG